MHFCGWKRRRIESKTNLVSIHAFRFWLDLSCSCCINMSTGANEILSTQFFVSIWKGNAELKYQLDRRNLFIVGSPFSNSQEKASPLSLLHLKSIHRDCSYPLCCLLYGGYKLGLMDVLWKWTGVKRQG